MSEPAPRARRRVTITDVGEAAGVSASTVSRVLNGTAKVDPALVQRVHDVVRELGYQPNAAAQGLARGEWGTVGVLVPDLANPYFPDVLKAVSAVARERGKRVMVMESDENPAIERSLVEDLMRSCDGVLLCSPRMPLADLVDLIGREHPMVLVNRTVPGAAVPSITVDHSGGMTLVCGHLAQLGHRRIAYLNGPESSWANSERLRALEAAAALGLDVTVVPCGADATSGYEAMAAVPLADVTAIATYNDLVALGAIARLRDMGVAVPEEMTVVGFDDLSLEWVAHSRLTTVSVARDEVGRRAAEMLEQLMAAGHDSEPREVAMELRVRDTSGPPRAAPPVLS